MARVMADAEVTRALCAPGRLHIAAYEGPRAHVLAGPTAGIREMARRAGALGVPVEVLTGVCGPGGVGGTSPMHSAGMARCAAPLRSVFAGTSFAPPRRRLVSTITGRLLMPQDDIAGLLASQVCLPVLFAQAMAEAAKAADLIVTAGPDAGLTARAAECGQVPAVAIPASLPAGGLGVGVRADADRATLTQAMAALFAAGAITDLMPLLDYLWPPGSPGADVDTGTLASRIVPRMRVAEQPVLAPPAAPDAGVAGNGTGARTTVRSGY
jgi:enediyne polyketide synthase